MSREIVDLSPTNPRIKTLRKIATDKAYRSESNLSVIQGDSLLHDLLLSNSLYVEHVEASDNKMGFPVKEIYVDTLNPSAITKLTELIGKFGTLFDEVGIYGINSKTMASVSPLRTSPGLIGIVKVQRMGTMDSLNYNENILVLDAINDPNNLGPIVRSAVAFNFNQIVLTQNSCEFYSPKVIRSSAGTVFYVRPFVQNRLETALDLIKKSGQKIYGTYVNRGTSLEKMTFAANISLVLGSEAHGLNETLWQMFDESITIDTAPNVESLNLSVSAGIILRDICIKQSQKF